MCLPWPDFSWAVVNLGCVIVGPKIIFKKSGVYFDVVI